MPQNIEGLRKRVRTPILPVFSLLGWCAPPNCQHVDFLFWGNTPINLSGLAPKMWSAKVSGEALTIITGFENMVGDSNI